MTSRNLFHIFFSLKITFQKHLGKVNQSTQEGQRHFCSLKNEAGKCDGLISLKGFAQNSASENPFSVKSLVDSPIWEPCVTSLFEEFYSGIYLSLNRRLQLNNRALSKPCKTNCMANQQSQFLDFMKMTEFYW
eukprot:TRINITY_DN19051_c0_g1_i2.p1 TRINITY_DN19051_c0_g1~~TRINITY_DN19051_c0_g1_i2.p1  ORF type:complete len:133 (+),score=7.00 TRINITY_DN19051_c0_g1_i2:251-649(+)